MSTSPSEAEILRNILENMNNPEMLNLHPWTSRLFVKDVLKRNPALRKESPGQQLIAALSDLFSRTMPSTPPRRGKRLDSHWGEFGILAARYFAPLQFGAPVPNTLRDAWGRIDSAILYSVYGKPVEALSQEEIKLYQLVGAELEYSCASTLSDWHKKGLQRFTEFILNHEHFLSRNSVVESDGRCLKPSHPGWDDIAPQGKTLGLVGGQPAIGPCPWAWVAQDLQNIFEGEAGLSGCDPTARTLARLRFEIKRVETALPVLKRLQGDMSSLKEESHPLLWLAPKLGWLPVYGNDLTAAPTLVELSEHSLNASLLAGEAAQPVLAALEARDTSLDPAGLTALLVQAQPALGEARAELDQALALRKRIDAEGLSPRLRDILDGKLDPALKLADESLSLGMALPGIAGASKEGPQTYLLLVQNEDELRPTGGFITSVGNLVVSNGQIISLEFEVYGRAGRLVSAVPARSLAVAGVYEQLRPDPAGCQLVYRLPDHGPLGGIALRLHSFSFGGWGHCLRPAFSGHAAGAGWSAECRGYGLSRYGGKCNPVYA